ncbi:MAG: hypothetical protein JXB50_15685 [Spirochaetes bacterium]|nr:hypothetical protein [Spirochaetota bacterium]
MIRKTNSKSSQYKFYKLYKYIICFSGKEISALDHIYLPELNKIREISHPAVIDKVNSVLLIKQYILKGKDTAFTLDTFKEFISKLPDWDLTDFFQIKYHINNNSGNFKCLCSPFLEIEKNNGKESACI